MSEPIHMQPMMLVAAESAGDRRIADSQWLLGAADELDQADRMGATEDKPEGSRYVHCSDTMLRNLAAKLREIAG